jgi:peptide/nickel transport system permease protein
VGRRIARRLLGALGVLWAAATFTFLVQTLLPGNRAVLVLNDQLGQARIAYPPAQLAPVNQEFGFSKPLVIQYLDYLSGLVHANLGQSYALHEPVTTVIRSEATPTLILTVTALVLAWIMSLCLTVLTAKRVPLVSVLGSGLEIAAAAVPAYWIGVLLLVVFAIDLRVLPVQGGTSLPGLVLPAFTLAIPLAGFLGQLTRDAFETAMDQPFVTSARARGARDTRVRMLHVLRHAVLPAVTASGWAMGSLISGAVIAETIFARPGLGQILVAAAEQRDAPVVSGVVILVAAVYVIANLLVDIAYTLIDPRLAAT